VANTQEIFDQLFSNTGAGEELSGTLLLIEVERVLPRDQQPRTYFDPEALAELANDIRELAARGGGVGGSGILQPLLVDAEENGNFRIVAGERRYRAAGQAGLTVIPVIVRDNPAISSKGTEWWEDALRENIQREDLTPLEEAQALALLAQEHGYSVRTLAERLGKGKGYVEHRLALAKAAPDVQDMVSRRRDTLSIAREIDKVEDAALRRRLVTLALDGTPVKRLREIIENAQPGQDNTLPPEASKAPPANQLHLLEKRITKLGRIDSVTMAARALQHSIQCSETPTAEDYKAVSAAIPALKAALEELEAWSRSAKASRK
jgi:ParB family chromosome partitioning protein